MENRFDDYKVIIPKSNKKISVAMFLNLNWIQAIAITCCFMIAILLIAFLDINAFARVGIAVVIGLLSGIFWLKLQGKILYQYIIIWMKWKTRSKSDKLALVKSANNIQKIENNYFAVFKINSESINFLSEEDQIKLLNNFWSLIKQVDNGSFIKIPNSFNFDKYNDRIKNFDPEFLVNENKIIKSFENSQNLNEFYFVATSLKEQTIKNDIQRIIGFLSSNYIKYTLTSYEPIEKYFALHWLFKPEGFQLDKSKKGFIYQIRDMAIENNFYYLKELFTAKNCFTILNFSLINQAQAKKQLDGVVNKLNYNLTKTNKESDSIENQRTHEAVQLQLDSIVDNSDCFKNINLYVGCIDSEFKEINQSKSLISNICNTYNFKLDKCLWEQDIILMNALSFKNIIDRNSLNMVAKTLARGYFLDKDQLNDENGYLLGEDNNGNPVFLDTFKINNSRKSHNMVLFGTPGSGKTTLLTKWLQYQHEIKTKIFLIDVEDEYSQWVENAGGELIDLAGGKATINPLEIIAGENQSYLDNLSQQEIALEGFLKMLYPEIENQAKEYILSTIRKMYLALFKKSKATPKWFTFSDVIVECKKNKTMYEKVYFYLEPIITRYGKYWNQPTTLKISNNNLICARLQNKESNEIDLPNLVLSVQIYLITKYIDGLISQARVNAGKCLIVLDEAHRLVSDNNEFILMYLSNLAKRVRKYNTGLVLATQNITDFDTAKNNQKYFANIFKCMQYFFFGGMHAQDISSLDKLLADAGGLTESQKNFLVLAQKGQFILQVDNNSFVDLKVKIAN